MHQAPLPDIQLTESNENTSTQIQQSPTQYIPDSILNMRKIPCVVYLSLVISTFMFLLNQRLFITISAVFNIYLVFAIWLPIGNQLEKESGTLRYSLYLLFNSIVIYALLPIIVITSLNQVDHFLFSHFCLFEILLFYLHNTDKTTRFFCFEIKNTYSSLIIFISFFCFNQFKWKYIMIPIYAYLFKKFIMKKISINNEIIIRIEKKKIMNSLISFFPNYITIKEIAITFGSPQENKKKLTMPSIEYDINSLTKEQFKNYV